MRCDRDLKRPSVPLHTRWHDVDPAQPRGSTSYDDDARRAGHGDGLGSQARRQRQGSGGVDPPENPLELPVGHGPLDLRAAHPVAA